MRAGPRNKLTAREREEHEVTHMPFRDRCTHCMMGRGRTHHHVSKKRSGDIVEKTNNSHGQLSFLMPDSTVNSQTISDESVTCSAVKEDRHQNIVSSVVLKEGIEEPWASERVVRFINSLRVLRDHVETDTDPATIAFRNRVAENCNAEVTLENAVGDKPSNGSRT